ncbi:MAG: metallophosphoesterase family protein [Gammaproteobacteria bacterium]
MSLSLKILPRPCRAFIVVLLLLPVIAVAGEPLRVGVISDMNGSYGSSHYEATVDAAMTRLLDLKPDLVISTGDMVAGQRRPHLLRTEIEPMWQAFHVHVSKPLAGAGIPFVVTPGNHDGSAYQGFALERAIYAEQWVPRERGVRFVDDAGYPFHYAFELEGVLFISLDATVVGHLPRSQMDWLRGVLEEKGQHYRRRVVFSHLPLWPFAQGRERDFIGDPDLQTLLEAADVDLYLSGHHHAFYPGSMRGIAFVSQSCLGAAPRRLLGVEDRSPRSFTLIEISDDELNIAAVAAPQFESAIDWNTLPARIHSSAAKLKRADLSDAGVGRLRLE